MQMDSDLVIYRTTLVRTFQVVAICRVDKSELSAECDDITADVIITDSRSCASCQLLILDFFQSAMLTHRCCSQLLPVVMLTSSSLNPDFSSLQSNS
ncbi:short-chain dehydrogenase/reductase superfamily protein [Dorcoceras hygrometricum]|uniref:Short-chain dehydrogenase/reductase superfamily protein n=1 Tax=Dorcoceras hygrometricum TaxID=472368 RepID=A0A2Z7DCD0_9LAMI|nr:short-chain dehydrogenase/reductase superfamily protein [Dorcoceras hygrometricum]